MVLPSEMTPDQSNSGKEANSVSNAAELASSF
jgi:hypothetical protein